MAILGSPTWDAVREVATELIAVIVGAVVANVAVIGVARRWIDQWRRERALALFGTVTGTAPSGLALLALAGHGGGIGASSARRDCAGDASCFGRGVDRRGSGGLCGCRRSVAGISGSSDATHIRVVRLHDI